MSFPVVFNLFGMPVPAHLVFEMLAYGTGFRLYLWLRRKTNDPFSDTARTTVFVGAVVGAALGSKLLAFAEHPELWRPALANPVLFLAAKTILGALLGGIIGVETVKLFAGIRRSTGDIYVFPLLVAIMIGRIGCLLTGVSDGTWGDATHLPWGFDAGDGIARHPTPLYEIIFLAVLGVVLWAVRRSPRLREGDLFKLFICGYCLWRLGIEFLKPVSTYTFTNKLNIVQNIATDSDLRAQPGLSLLQLSALVALVYYAVVFARRWRGRAADGGA